MSAHSLAPGVWVMTLVGIACLASGIAAAGDAAWIAKIRADHPRLFFNKDTWPAVRANALGVEKEWYARIKGEIDRDADRDLKASALAARDRGQVAARAAFLYRVTGQRSYLELARRYLASSVEYYEQCYANKKAVDWYSTSRVHAALAWDWLYDDLDAAWRREIMERLVDNIHKVITARPAIYRENLSGYSTGFYGVRNALWFIGCAAHGTDVRPDRVREWLVWGHDENLKMLEHRKRACGDDGGSASPTLGYAFGAYPWAEQNFFYTWKSATGEDIAPSWPHSAWLANYVDWNWIASPDGDPYEFGYGDTPHTSNRLTVYYLYTHMANVRHLFGAPFPEAAALASRLQQRLPERRRRYDRSWFVYPFLWTHPRGVVKAPREKAELHARYFEEMGQLFMRSGREANDTYCLFTCGGSLRQHRHFDALNFVIYKHGHLALDTGTRWSQFKNGEHLANYYAQTVAHNCVLIHMPDEPPARYWGGGPAKSNYGGQNAQLGSVVEAFETNDLFTYVAGDATKCYSSRKCKLATRQLVFVMPDHFVVFDRVTTTRPEYRACWLIHPGGEPRVDGAAFRSEHLDGAMYCRTLFPREPKLDVVGGSGNEFRTGSVNWKLDTGSGNNRLGAAALDMIGRWRVEVSSSTSRAENAFLHVIEVGPKSMRAAAECELVQCAGALGVKFRAGRTHCELVFATAGPPSGHISLEGNARVDRQLARNVLDQSGTAEGEKVARTSTSAARRTPTARRTPAPATPTPMAGAVAEFDTMLLARIAARLEAGAKVEVYLSSFRQRARVTSVDGRALNMTVRGTATKMDIGRFKLNEKKALALQAVDDREPMSHAITAFYALASGDGTTADEHMRRAGEYAELVRGFFVRE